MDLSFKLATEALDNNEVPVGCAFVFNGRIVASGRNEVNATRDATQHAEIVALRKMEHWCMDNHLEIGDVMKDCELYVTVEPCIMCIAALRFVFPTQPKCIIYGAQNERFGGCGSVLNAHTSSGSVAPIHCVAGVEADKAVSMLKKFYAQENMNAPEELRKLKPGRAQKLGGSYSSACE